MTLSKERDWLSLSLSFIVTENVLPLWSFLCKLFTLGKVRRGIIKFEPEAQTSTCEFLYILMTFKEARGGANGEMANLTNEKGKFAIAIFRHFSPFFAIFRHW